MDEEGVMEEGEEGKVEEDKTEGEELKSSLRREGSTVVARRGTRGAGHVGVAVRRDVAVGAS